MCKYNYISLIIHANHAIQCVYTMHLVPLNYFQHCEYISTLWFILFILFISHDKFSRFIYNNSASVYICKLLFLIHDCYRALTWSIWVVDSVINIVVVWQNYFSSYESLSESKTCTFFDLWKIYNCYRDLAYSHVI